MSAPRRPTLDELSALAPQLAYIQQHAANGFSPSDAIARLPDRYVLSYDPPTIARHVEMLCSISREEPYILDARRMADGRVELTIVSIDDPGMLSLLAGSLAAAGFSIQSGDVFTLEREPSSPVRSRARGGATRVAQAPIPTRRIVDRFAGELRPGFAPERFFAELTGLLDRVIPLILPGGDRNEARRLVNEAVADRLRKDEASVAQTLYPLEIRFDLSHPSATRMIITGEDTPFFLYALSAGLSLQGISIETVTIETHRQVISDVFELLDASGERITDAAALDRIRFSVLLTKQFTYFLDRAPDPYAALVRFESMSRDLVRETQDSGIGSLLSEPLVLRELAHLLGASDFLWEDFIRLQYENIIPMLTEPRELSSNPRDIELRLQEAMRHARTLDEQRELLNEFKDREAFLIDLDHILHPDHDFFFLSDRLTNLAEIVVRQAIELSWGALTERYGRPRAVAGLETQWAVFGLGKLGGRALGYASDIELLFVYRDSGTTDGPSEVPNAEFFERLVMDATGSIRSRREGIFRVDLRLRPYGQAGPHAVSLESFNRYYGRDGDAHSYEKLALTRLRRIGGSESFGLQVEELRDDLLYRTDSIDLAELRSLRERQFREKSQPGRLNAKFSPGALVDLEYGLQILLVQHGRTNPRLRTPSLHAGLDELERSGVMEPDETHRLVRSYRFLRNLINGLRMLRGNAQDLFLPEVDSLEYAHLARRAGYGDRENLSAARQLHVEFEARTAAVRAFLEQHLGRESIPGPRPGNAADLVLATGLPENLTAQILEGAGLRNHTRALRDIIALSGQGSEREVFSELIILAWQALRANIDPDTALNNWERYACRLPDRAEHYRRLLSQPHMLDLMLQVFATSSFLSDTLIQHPAFLDWALDPDIVSRVRTDRQMIEDIRAEGIDYANATQRKTMIRRRRKQELLRIGTRDICLRASLRTITQELSAIARALLVTDLEAIWTEMEAVESVRRRFVVLAFGKLGGNELNYSSDIDLLGIFADGEPDLRERDSRLFADVLSRLRADLSQHTAEGYAYRVDFRLRPYGSSGPLVQPFSAAVRYYENDASAWEHQALLKLSPVAGDIALGTRFLEAIKPVAFGRLAAEEIRAGIRILRSQAVRQTTEGDIKTGEGGIRDIEFLVQGLQLIHSKHHPDVLTGNTLEALDRLLAVGALQEPTARELQDDYERMRRVEHFLQIYEDRQVHALPRSAGDQAALARRIDGPTSDAQAFTADIARRRSRVRSYYERFLASGVTDEESAETTPRTDG